jgi:hypothetical protein
LNSKWVVNEQRTSEACDGSSGVGRTLAELTAKLAAKERNLRAVHEKIRAFSVNSAEKRSLKSTICIVTKNRNNINFD